MKINPGVVALHNAGGGLESDMRQVRRGALGAFDNVQGAAAELGPCQTRRAGVLVGLALGAGLKADRAITEARTDPVDGVRTLGVGCLKGGPGVGELPLELDESGRIAFGSAGRSWLAGSSRRRWSACGK
jgi:hypothetical protein